jgi:protein phosphatase 1 regulatory subunit 37
MTSAGAIALAEFLPESTSLLHLDLTMNSLDLAGVMALSSGLKANHVMRCLDVNIPPGDEEFARSVFYFIFIQFLFFGKKMELALTLEGCV